MWYFFCIVITEFFQRFRTPSRSRSRSATPIHWRKEESRVIKLSEYEKLEAKRKKSDGKRTANGGQRNSSSDRNKFRSDTPPLKDFKGRIDYNALDYEDQSDEENTESRKQVPSLVQYPLPGAYNKFKSEEEVRKEREKEEKEIQEAVALNKRSDFLAMALGTYFDFLFWLCWKLISESRTYSRLDNSFIPLISNYIWSY